MMAPLTMNLQSDEIQESLRVPLAPQRVLDENRRHEGRLDVHDSAVAVIAALLAENFSLISKFPCKEPGFIESASGPIRWTRYRKAALVVALARGQLGVGEALSRFHLSTDELTSWIEKMTDNGVDALRANHHWLGERW